MEVRDESTDKPEAMPRIDEKICLSARGLDNAARRDDQRLERPSRCSPHRDDATTLMKGVCHGRGSFLRHLEALWLDCVFLDLFDSNRFEGAITDMQRDLGPLDTPSRESLE